MAVLIKEMADGKDANPLLKEMSEDLEKNPPKDKNNGHYNLMQDLTELLYEAHHFEFHDFKNKKYPTPKAELRAKLLLIANNVVSGKYDN